MKAKVSGITVIFAIILAGCASYNRNNIRKNIRPVVIRYMSLKTVYNRALSMNEKASLLINTAKDLSTAINDLEKRIMISGKDREKLISELEIKRKELKKLNKNIGLIKSDIYKRINEAVKRVARNIGADFVLNIGDGVLYSRKEYDITEEIIREMVNLSKRSAPVSR